MTESLATRQRLMRMLTQKAAQRCKHTLRNALSQLKKRMVSNRTEIDPKHRADYFLVALRHAKKVRTGQMDPVETPYSPPSFTKETASSLSDLSILRMFSLQTTMIPTSSLPVGVQGKQLVLIDTHIPDSGFPLSDVMSALSPHVPDTINLYETLRRVDVPFAIPHYFTRGDAVAVTGILGTFSIGSRVLDAVPEKKIPGSVRTEESSGEEEKDYVEEPFVNQRGERVRYRSDKELFSK